MTRSDKMSAKFGGLVFGSAPSGITCLPRQAAYAIITGENGRVAAVRARLRDGRERYWLPGGGIEAGESPHDAGVREVREELGRGVRVQDEVGEAVQFFYAGAENQWYEMRATFFRATLDEPSSSGSEFEMHWVDYRVGQGSFFHECHAWAASLSFGGHAT